MAETDRGPLAIASWPAYRETPRQTHRFNRLLRNGEARDNAYEQGSLWWNETPIRPGRGRRIPRPAAVLAAMRAHRDYYMRKLSAQKVDVVDHEPMRMTVTLLPGRSTLRSEMRILKIRIKLQAMACYGPGNDE